MRVEIEKLVFGAVHKFARLDRTFGNELAGYSMYNGLTNEEATEAGERFRTEVIRILFRDATRCKHCGFEFESAIAGQAPL